MHTEDEARKLWCPMVRHYNGSHNAKGHERTPDGCLCIASGCPMWRWAEKTPQHGPRIGFCGLAGKP